MPTVAITVDCEAANENRCFTPEIVKIAEEFMVPVTWLIYVSEKVPTANADLYYREYLHRIPSWHEIGMHVHFENQNGYVEDERARGSIIRMAKDVLKSHLIKPTSFRAGCFSLLPSDVKYLEDVGILVKDVFLAQRVGGNVIKAADQPPAIVLVEPPRHVVTAGESAF